MARKSKPPSTPSKSTPLSSLRHKDTRKNIPTEELRNFIAEEEQKPKTLLYPRDPSLDPQLVWKGKDEQDAKPLEVPAVPIYIQEKIHPQAIIEDFRESAASAPTGGSGPAEQLGLFADFNGGPEDFDKRVDFYHHDQHWSNRMILGDSLMVMTSLAEKENLKGKVQCIYFDPPYGIKFGSNWQVSTRKRDVKDGKAEDVTRQPEQIKAFRDCYKLGIHSYLPYLRDRLTLARELLTESGSIFLQIGDENVHLVRCLMDEVFGSENFVSQILFKKTGGLKSKGLASVGDYLLWYAKDFDHAKQRRMFRDKKPGTSGATQFKYIFRENGTLEELSPQQLLAANPGELLSHDNLTSQGNSVYTYSFNGRDFSGAFKPPPKSMDSLVAAGRIIALGKTLRYVRRLNDFEYVEFNELWDDLSISGFADEKVYVVQTLTDVVQRCLLMTTDPGDLVLDPTCGSGTTAYVAEQWGRRWITTDTSRVALALARTRLMAAKYPFYLLTDSADGAAKEREVGPAAGNSQLATGNYSNDIRRGFVYKRVPHVTLKSIANNPDIKERMTRQQIDAAISRHADTETLYDKPYEDAKRIRVTGPFTVESLSPHRTISVEQKQQAAGKPTDLGFTMKMLAGSSFSNMILDNLRAAGVQNTRKAERLKFDSLEVYPGQWINGVGLYTEADGKQKRAAICIGPEHGTVGPELIKEAAKEAVLGVGFDVLIVCGFAFDPHAGEEAKRYGKLVVLPTKMNPDLSMGDELLKKTGAGNLFMVFGEPDVEITRVNPAEPKDKAAKGKKPAGQVVVEIKGLDVYDPTTGEIRSSATDDIACWFIDTNYNGESFFVRHAYFTGADEPYEKLKRALRAEIDEGAWQALYSTRSRPFDAPATGKIAVKVINHYGDEVLKVFEVK